MAAYLVADVLVTDVEGYEEYRQRVPATIAAYGGRCLARGGTCEALEGDWAPNRFVILEFPTWTRSRRGTTRPSTGRCARSATPTATTSLVVAEGLCGFARWLLRPGASTL